MFGPASIVTLLLLALPATAAPAKMNAAKFTVILDPGHGGDDTGAITHAQGRQIFEKIITLAIARETERVLRSRGVAVVLTRSRDQFVPLDQRTRLANLVGNHTQSAVFVSIHANSSDDSRNSGAEIYVFNAATNEASRRLADLENGKNTNDPGHRPALMTQSHAMLDLILADLATTANYSESVDLACAVEHSIFGSERSARGRSARSGSNMTRDRGLRQALFYVLMETHMPGILFEPGFISNPQDLARLLNPAYQVRLAHNLASGILKWHQTQGRRIQTVSAVDKARPQRCHIVKN